MRNRIAKISGVLGLALSAATGAQALTTLDGSAIAGAAPTPFFSSGGPADAQVFFTWFNAPASAYIDFTTTNAFSLFFTAYASSTPGVQSGFALYERGASLSLVGSPTGACTGTVSLIAGLCQYIGATPNSTRLAPSNGTAVYADLEAGSYRLGFFESAIPVSGLISFAIDEDFTISEVPLPAGGLLLLGALGAFAATKRRRKAA